MQAAAEQHKAAKQTYTWSTPFFDVEFVDIRTRKGNTGSWVFPFFCLNVQLSGSGMICSGSKTQNPKTKPNK
jgi:hypothetical protein